MISVVIPTFNRANLLSSSLESLTHQNIARTDYEIVVVNDGSTDETSEVCQTFSGRIPLRYFRIENSGISAAKNLGIFASTGQIILFFDDDDVAHPNLLREHLKAHDEHPAENVAILGYTTWDPKLTVTPVMDYVMNIGQILFAYRDMQDGKVLDFHYFWGGRSSCKRSLLAQHGVFNQRFRFIIEDIELGYRLWKKASLKVIHRRNAISYMTRPVSYEQFCKRCERQGAALAMFRRRHPDRAVQEYCQLQIQHPSSRDIFVDSGAETGWQELRQQLHHKTQRVQQLERIARTRNDGGELVPKELAALYRWTFNAFKVKGIVEQLHPPVVQCGQLGSTE